MTFFGPDLSVYQSGVNLTDADWDIDFLIARCIRRGREVDTSFERWRIGAQRHNIPFGSYAFVRPLSIVPLRQQVDAILRAMGDTPVPVWFDHEADGKIPPVSDHDLLLLGEACEQAGLSVPTVYTGWYSDTAPFTPTDLAFLGYSGIINARYPRQSNTTPPRGDPEEWYEAIGGDVGAGWDYDPGPKVSPVPVLAWQYTSACTWGDVDRVDWNAVTNPAVMELLFHDWTPPAPPSSPPTEGDHMIVAILAEDVPEMGLGATAYVAGNIVHGLSHISGPEADEVFRQFQCVQADDLTPVTNWGQVTPISAVQCRQRYGRRVS